MLHAQVLAMSRRVLGVGHPDTCLAARHLAYAYTTMGKDAEAAALHALYDRE